MASNCVAKNHMKDSYMRALVVYILAACATFGIGLASNRIKPLFFGSTKLDMQRHTSTITVAQIQRSDSTIDDPCYEPLQVVKTQIMIRSIPFVVMRRCVEADQAKPYPLLDKETAESFLKGSVNHQGGNMGRTLSTKRLKRARR